MFTSYQEHFISFLSDVGVHFKQKKNGTAEMLAFSIDQKKVVLKCCFHVVQ